MEKKTDALQTDLPWRHQLGILGGLGPYAHLAFERALLEKVKAQDDQGFPPWVLVSAPHVPSRRLALEGGPSPVGAVLDGLSRLCLAGASFGVMACNLIHHWFDEIAIQSPLPLLNLTTESLRVLKEPRGEVGILAPSWTIQCELYPQLARRSCLPIRFRPPDAPTQALLDRAIWCVKRGEDAEIGHQALSEALHFFDGCERVLLACTELSSWGKEQIGERAVDPVDIGAEAALKIMRGERELPSPYLPENPLDDVWDARR